VKHAAADCKLTLKVSSTMGREKDIGNCERKKFIRDEQLSEGTE